MLPGIAASVAACDVGGMIVEVADRWPKALPRSARESSEGRGRKRAFITEFTKDILVFVPYSKPLGFRGLLLFAP